jgi:nucleoside-diphosphate-sugar epimerase
VPAEPNRVVIVGAAGSLGRRVCAALGPVAVGHDDVDLATADLVALVTGATCLVHLAFATAPVDDEDAIARRNTDGARRLFAAAVEAGVEHLVLLSDATVYGAWPDSPVPLTEDAPVRPNPGASYPVQKAELERTTRELDLQVTILRPAVAVAGGDWGWLARSLNLARGARAGAADPPFQLLHLDDLAEAVAHVVRNRVVGVFNVAPDGWMSGEEVRALAGDPPRLRVPGWLLVRRASVLWRWRVGRMPPALVPYTMHPWVLANDRLRATGWAPTRSNQETYVEATPGTPWSQVSPKRRQELALGATATVGLGGIGAAVGALLRRRRRRH